MPVDQSETVTSGASQRRQSLFHRVSISSLCNGGAFVCSISLGCATMIQAQPLAESSVSELSTGPVTSVTTINTTDPAIPSAREVVQDLPSALHLSRHQRGEINGLRYVLFPDGSGKVMHAKQLSSALFRLSCKKGVACTVYGADGDTFVVPAVGGPRPVMPPAPSGKALAQYLSEWILSGTGTPISEPIAPPPQRIDERRVAQVQSPQSTNSADGTADAGKETAAVTAVPRDQNALGTAGSETEAAPVAPAGITDEADTQFLVPLEQPAHLPCTIEDPDVDCSEPQLEKLNAIKAVQTTTKKVKTASSSVARQTSPRRANVVTRGSDPSLAPSGEETFFKRINLACSITGSVTLRYKHHDTGAKRFGKPRASLSCGARLSEKLSLRASVIGYADTKEKSPSDAEFTYALSYKATKNITLSYSNYSGRFDGTNASFFGSLISGALRASYSLPKIKLPNEKVIGCSTSVNLLDLEYGSLNLFCSYAVTDRLRISGTAYAYLPGKQDPWDPDFAYGISYKISDDWSVTYSNYANNRFFWNQSQNSGEGIWGGTISVAYKFNF
ncbi:hypothetical protein [Sulfitobacter sp. R86518]|uniref:hypothetical protein n=1 Tax=Sulfitobacter sp. R86518 TaxID=3093858 RepID=UPI0036DB4DDD